MKARPLKLGLGKFDVFLPTEILEGLLLMVVATFVPSCATAPPAPPRVQTEVPVEVAAEVPPEPAEPDRRWLDTLPGVGEDEADQRLEETSSDLSAISSDAKIHSVWIWQETGDCLWKMAKDHYGNPTLWRAIYEANRHIIEDPHVIFPKQEIVIPPLNGKESPW